MNELSEIDKVLLESIKSKIEHLSGLSGDADLSQKDFDFLLYYIQEKTGQALSLTTLKRIWRKEYQRLPHLSTLNMLAQLACGLDWHTAKRQFLEDQSHHQHHVTRPARATKKKVIGRSSVKILAGLAVVITLSWYYIADLEAGDPAKIQFSAEVTTDQVIPNSVVFSYDVEAFKAKRFFIQQSWDPAKIVEISPTNKKQTDIYYEPGYHYAKLLGNEKVLKEIPVHIKYNDWYVRFRYPNSELVRVSNADLHTTGYLGLKEDYLNRRFNPLGTKFQLGFMLSKDFNLKADDLQLQATVRFDSVYAPSCPMINLLIKGNKNYAWITVGNKGCESNLSIKVSERFVNGKTNDLSALGIHAYSWEKLHVKLSNGKFILSINNKVVHECSYNEGLGELKEIDIFFNGIGSIADVKIGDGNPDSMITAN